MSKYSFFWRNRHQLFYMRGNLEAYTRYQHIPFNTIEDILQVSHESEQSCYLGVKDWEKQVEEGRMFLDRSLAIKYLQDAKEQCHSHRKFFHSIILLNVVHATNAELLAYWKELMDQYTHTIAYFRSTQDEPSRLIVEKVTQALVPEEAEILMLSPELDEINKEGIAWQELLKKGFTEERAFQHIAEFPWLFQNALHVEETIQELKERLAGHQEYDIREEKRILRENQEKILSVHPALRDDVATLHGLALLRPAVKSCWAATGYYANYILTEVARRFEIDLHTLTFFYLDEDVVNLLKENIILTKQEVAERREGVLYVLQSDHSFKRVIGKEATKMAQELLGSYEGEVKELRGAGAQKGKVTGTVWILQSNDTVGAQKLRRDFHDAVLVTGMTQPNIVDIARRASAIVTDEGGMLCHAAIISREFGIPCVVGTKIATQALKDGDLVEVDADSGIVRILERV